MTMVTLSDVTKIVTKGTTPTTLGMAFQDGGIPFIRVNNIQNKVLNFTDDVLYIDGQTHEKLSRSIIKPKDVLISIAGSIGRSCVVPDNAPDLNCNQAVCIIRCNIEKILPEYLSYWLGSEIARSQISNSKVTGVIQNLSLTQVKALKIDLPPLAEQCRIASILDKAYELRQKRQQATEKLDQLLLATFIDMFGDPVSNPKGWVKEKMDTLMTIVRGGSPRPIENFLGGNYPWIKIGDATKGDDLFITKTKEAITKEGLHKTRLLPEGSVIFANCGVSLGFARILKIQGCIHDGWLAFQDINEDKVHKLFLLKALNSITQYFRDTAPDGTQPNLNTTIMKNFELILPPMELQLKFITVVELIEKQKKMLDTSKTEVSNLFKSLQNQAFSGNL